MSVDLKAVCEAAKIELESHGKYPKKEYRNCECWGRVLAVFSSTLSTLREAHISEVSRLSNKATDLADRSSKESASCASMAVRLARTQLLAVGRGLEATSLKPEACERIMNVNAG